MTPHIYFDQDESDPQRKFKVWKPGNFDIWTNSFITCGTVAFEAGSYGECLNYLQKTAASQGAPRKALQWQC